MFLPNSNFMTQVCVCLENLAPCQYLRYCNVGVDTFECWVFLGCADPRRVVGRCGWFKIHLNGSTGLGIRLRFIQNSMYDCRAVVRLCEVFVRLMRVTVQVT